MARSYDDNFDERGLLKDGRRVSISMMMRDGVTDDGLSNLQRSVRDAAAPSQVVDEFGNSGLALSKPGARDLTAGRLTTDHGIEVTREFERHQAYADSVREMCDAWKGPNASDRECQRIHDTGNPIADAYLDQLYDLQNSWCRKR